MTHASTAHTMKGRGAGAPPRPAPRPGTRIRRAYDLLVANPGRWVRVTAEDLGMAGSMAQISKQVDYLRDSYGLDIKRKMGSPTRARGSGGEWLLAGEYVGAAYLDYVADPSLCSRQDDDIKRAHSSVVEPAAHNGVVAGSSPAGRTI